MARKRSRSSPKREKIVITDPNEPRGFAKGTSKGVVLYYNIWHYANDGEIAWVGFWYEYQGKMHHGSGYVKTNEMTKISKSEFLDAIEAMGAMDEYEDVTREFNPRRNMSPTRHMPRVAMGERELASKITEALDSASAKLNTAKYYITLLEKVVGEEIDDSQVVEALLDIQNFAKWVYEEFGEE